MSARFGNAPPKSTAKVEKKNKLVWWYLLTVAAYLCAGVIIYSTVSGMTVIDALYFCVVTLTTVGYGDLSAHKADTKIFACLYILIGVALIGAFLSQLVEMLLDSQEKLLLKVLEDFEDMTEPGSVNSNEERREDTGIMRSSAAKRKQTQVKVWSGIAWFFLLVLAGTLMFMFGENLSLVDALYLTVVSASTVGYGDYHPDSIATKTFAILFLPLTTLLLGQIISDYTAMRVELNREARQHRILYATITAADFAAMDSNNDNKVDKYEFLCRQLVAQEKVEQEWIDEIETRFAELDVDSDGALEHSDLTHSSRHVVINVPDE